MMVTNTKCRFSQVQTECRFIPSQENCRECLVIELNEVYGESNVCSICGADRVNYLEMMKKPCWHGHKEAISHGNTD